MSGLKVAVFGPSGMLGRQVVIQLKDQGYEPEPVYRRLADLTDRKSVEQAVRGCDAAINCAGVIPIRNTDIPTMIHINSVFPHILAGSGLDRVVLVSTDCVFSGRATNKYTVKSAPDPKDYYGRSKVLGEVASQNCCVVRTSFIGCEHGFMHFVMSAGTMAKSFDSRARIDGYKNALWTGSTVSEVATKLVELLGEGETRFKPGLVHLATEQVVNKYDLAVKIVELKHLNVEVHPSYQPIVNRALEPTHILPDIDQALSNYACSGAIG